MRSLDELSLIAAIADDLAAGVWVVTVPDGRFVYANRAFAEIMGVGGLTDVAAGQYSEPYGIYDREGALYREDRLPFARALASGRTEIADDLVIHRGDGRRVFVRAHAKPMFDHSAQMTHIAIAFFDISREVEAENARFEAERRLRSVVASAPLVLYALDKTGVITFIEGRGLAQLGLKSGDMVGRKGKDLFPQLPEIAAHVDVVLSGGRGHTFIADLGTAVFEAHLSPHFDAEGAVAGAIGVLIDVTDRRRVEVKLAQAERLASVGMLAAGVAHEVNNPLSFVIGNLDLMAETLAEAMATAHDPTLDGLLPLVTDARVGADRVRAIVRGLKVFSRVDDQTPGPLDLRGPLEAAIGMAQNEIRHRARLVLDFHPVPPVIGDQGRAAQLFLNLLINAAQSITEGAADTQQITVTLRQDAEGWVRVEITDTGLGIPRDILPRIFDPFFTTKPSGQGTGLGLTTAYGTARQHHGAITVASDVGRGTTFTVLLPLSGVAVSDPVPVEAAPAFRGSGRALLVEDEEMLRTTARMILESLGFTVVEAVNGAEAVALYAADTAGFALVVVDMVMPVMNGRSCCERICALNPQARILLCSGYSQEVDVAALRKLGIKTMLNKPYRQAEFVAAVAAAITPAAG